MISVKNKDLWSLLMTTDSHSSREWLSVPEWRDRHPHIGKNKVYESVHDGTLLSLRLGSKILIASDALEVLSSEDKT